MRLLHSSSLLLLGLVGLGCTTTATTTTITRPELVQVLPEDFLGTLKCGEGAGKVGSYVATLFDVTTDASGMALPETGFPLPSSPPTSCNFPVTFSYVLVDHSYLAQIEAYDLLTEADAKAAREQSDAGDAGDAAPLEFIQAVSLGGRLQQNAEGVRVTPHWKATCGGYPPTQPDGGIGPGPDASGVIASDGGVVSYAELTTTVHDCKGGLVSVN